MVWRSDLELISTCFHHVCAAHHRVSLRLDLVTILSRDFLIIESSEEFSLDTIFNFVSFVWACHTCADVSD